MRVRQKNPLYEARQLTADNVEDIAKWVGSDNIRWGRRDEAGNPQPLLIIEPPREYVKDKLALSYYVRPGDWIIANVHDGWHVIEVCADAHFQSEYKKEKE